MRVCRIVLALCVVTAAGCETVKMAVPADLAEASEELPIIGRSKFAGLPGVDESFKIGPYEITGVDRDTEFSGGGRIQFFTERRVVGGYHYLFRGGNGERQGECAVQAGRMGISPDGTPLSVNWSQGTLACVCQGGEGASDFTLGLRYVSGARPGKREGGEWLFADGSEHSGELHTRGRAFTVDLISKVGSKGRMYKDGKWEDMGSMPWTEPTGVRVDGDSPAGAVELLHPGRVWLARSLESTEREDMACLLGGIVLYDPPTDRGN